MIGLNILKKIEKYIKAIEESPAPLFYFILSFLAVVLLETFLEMFSDTAVVSFRLFPANHPLLIAASVSLIISIAHICLWWISAFLILAIIFSITTKEDIQKCLRIVFSFAWIILLGPVLDLVISRGQGIDIHYIRPKSTLDILFIFKQLTPGENLKASLTIILSFIYCLGKTKSPAKAILATLAVTCVTLTFSMLPFLMKHFNKILGLGLKFTSPIPIIRLFLILIFFELLAILRLKRNGARLFKLEDYWLLKLCNLILFFFLGVLLFRSHPLAYTLQNIGGFLLTITTIILTAWLLIIIRGISRGEEANSILPTIILGLAVFSAIAVNFTTFYFMLLACGSILVYYLEPFRLKRMTFISCLPKSFNLLLLVILGWLFAGGELLSFPGIIVIYFLVFITGCLNYTQLDDYSNNVASVHKRPPFFARWRHSRLFISCFFLFSYLAIGGIFLRKYLFLAGLLFGLLQFYLINRKKFAKHTVFLAHLLALACFLIWMNYFWRQAP